MKTECNAKLRVLEMLHENSKNSSPLPVYIDDMVMKLKLQRAYLQEILLRMNQSGDILCGNDGNHSIITRKGLDYYLTSSAVSLYPHK